MGRGRLQLKRIQSPARRQVTFSKRRNGLLKKACELSVLCGAEVAVIVISPTGKTYEFASHGMSATLEKYQKLSATDEICSTSVERTKEETDVIQNKLSIESHNAVHTRQSSIHRTERLLLETAGNVHSSESSVVSTPDKAGVPETVSSNESLRSWV